MQIFFTAFISSLVSFLAIDSIWLFTMSKAFYGKHMAHLLANNPNFTPAIFLYILYAVGITVLIVLPAVNGNFSLSKTFLFGALLGLVAYASYDLTNQATLRDWPVIVTLVDIVWGIFLTGFVSVIATQIVKSF